MNFKSQNFLFVLTLITSFSLTSCKDDDVTMEKPTTETIIGNITEDTRWTADKDYVLSGRVIVTDGATLTIDAGTVIKGESAPNDQASVLIIANDGKIQANGTATAPIIFTSVEDDVVSGEIVGTELDETDSGKWGGVIILGNAPISPESGTTARIEGIPPSVDEAAYGGNEPEHSSGKFTFVSIRHAGVALQANKEINGLTLGGVGSGTTISNVEIVSNLDDGIEFFGGTVDVSHAAVLYQGDDGFDIDQAYSGTLSNIIYIGSEFNNSDNALEIDGPKGAANATGKFTVRKGSLTGFSDDYAHLKANAQGDVQNLYFFGFPEVDFEILGDGAVTNFESGELNVDNCAFNDTRSLEDICKADVEASAAAVDTKFANANTQVSSAPGDIGASLSNFRDWTYADATGALSVFE